MTVREEYETWQTIVEALVFANYHTETASESIKYNSAIIFAKNNMQELEDLMAEARRRQEA